jgi:predicted RNA polymerase sigma factor
VLEWRAVSARDPHEAIRDVFRAESARLVGGLVRFVRDVGVAEELAQDALVVVRLNRAVAISMAEGPAAGLGLLDALADEPSLRNYHLLPSARAHLLEKLGRLAEARAELERAASMTENVRQKNRLLERARACSGATDEPVD